MVISLKEKTYIAILSFFLAFGLVMVISFFSIMVTEIINNGNFKALIFFIPIAIGLFMFFLSFNLLNRDKFVIGEQDE